MRNEFPAPPLPGACCDGPATPAPSSPLQEAELARLAKALGHPARVRLLRLLLAQDGCIAGDLQAEVGLAASTVSQHLKQLKDSGWVQGEVDGPRRCYCVDPATRARFGALLSELLGVRS